MRLLNINEVCVLVGCSTYTIDNWYRFKRLNPENELAQLLPEVYQKGDRQCRQWNADDVWKLIEFKTKRPTGKTGVMGSVTQKYVKKEKKNGQKRKRKKVERA